MRAPATAHRLVEAYPLLPPLPIRGWQGSGGIGGATTAIRPRRGRYPMPTPATPSHLIITLEGVAGIGCGYRCRGSGTHCLPPV